MGVGVDSLAKSAGWYRLLYGDLRHALDFRLMSERRVAILDSALSLSRRSSANHNDTAVKPESTPLTPKLAAKQKPALATVASPASRSTKQAERSELPAATDASRLGSLQPIPNFSELLRDALQDTIESMPSLAGPVFRNNLVPPSTPPISGPNPAVPPSIVLSSSASQLLAKKSKKLQVAQLDIGLVCDVEIVQHLVPRLHSRVLKVLAERLNVDKTKDAVLPIPAEGDIPTAS